jgi:WD40 repeat protein
VNVVWSVDGAVVATVQNNAAVRVWDASSGQQIGEEIANAGALEAETLPVAIAGVEGLGSILAIGNGYQVDLWQIAGTEITRRENPLPHNHHVRTLHFIPGSKVLVTGSWDATAKVWNLESEQLLHPAFEHGKGVHSAAVSEDGLVYATGSEDHYIRLGTRPPGPPWATN